MRKFFINKQMKMRKSITTLMTFLLLLGASAAFAQTFSVTGTVSDEAGEPLIGSSIVIKGTTNGTVTDIDGRFTLERVSAGSVLQFAFVGFIPQEIPVGAIRTFNVRLSEETNVMEELVVVGYGVQKKALVTGATINVQGEALQKMSPSNPLVALQAQSPGVNIMQSNGQPGSDFIVNIRGVGTNGEARPLYVIDGVAVGFNGLNEMNVADIESIDILKDAASSAIYGSRAANGVVLITTKQGKAGRARVTYDAYYAKQYMYKKANMLNAKEYMAVQDEISYNMGTTPYNWANLMTKHYPLIMSGEWEGSDWIDAFYCPGAPMQNHALNVTGGNDMSKYSFGYSYSDQYGILGEKAQSHFTRHTMRFNSDHVILKVRDFEAIKIGENINFMYRRENTLQTGDRFGNSLNSVMTANPMMPIYNESGENQGYYGYNDKLADGWTYDSNAGNPIGSIVLGPRGNMVNKSFNFNASVYLQVQPIKNLIFLSRYSFRYDASSNRNATMKSWLGISPTTTESVSQSQNMGYDWQLSNTLTYIFNLNSHTFNVVVGQEMSKSGYGESVSGSSRNNVFDLGFDYSWLSNMNTTVIEEQSVSGSPRGNNATASGFGRLSWNLKETYMADITLRADGSSRFAEGHRWGYFPAFSAGWVVTNEAFMETAKNTLNYLRLRGNWGRNGNSAITGFQYLSRYQYNNAARYIFNDDKKTFATGAIPGVLKNPNISWETTDATNLGFDARFLKNRLGVNFDYFLKDTRDWLLEAPISATWGFAQPYVNGGAVRNYGVELILTWNDRIKDFHYGFNLNGSYVKTRVTKIDNAEGIIRGPENVIAQTTGEMYRLEVGHPMGFFYGWKHDGLFQNWEEVYAYTNPDGSLIQPNAQPGDVRFRDIDGNGIIDVNDKTEIGCGWPKFTGGLSVTMDYKGVDLLLVASGKFGHQIIRSYRSFTSANPNHTTEVFNRWTGEGTSNLWPRLTSGNHQNYQYISNLFVENADFVKIQNITLGYDLKRTLRNLPFSTLRLYVTAQNLYTFTKYKGMDPEVGYGHGQSWVAGIDIGLYPGSRSYLVGVNVAF